MILAIKHVLKAFCQGSSGDMSTETTACSASIQITDQSATLAVRVWCVTANTAAAKLQTHRRTYDTNMVASIVIERQDLPKSEGCGWVLRASKREIERGLSSK